MTKVQGKGRGMLSLETWLPSRRPGKPRDPNMKPVDIAAMLKSSKNKKPEQNGSAAKGTCSFLIAILVLSLCGLLH